MIVENDKRAVITHDFMVDHEYEVVVRAVGEDDTQEAMESAVRGTIVIEGKVAIPSAPTDPLAEGFLNAIVVSWTNPTDYDLKHVEVWRAVIGVQTLSTKVAEIKGTTFTDELGAGGLTRYYWLRAVNTSGQVSDYSTRVVATSVAVAVTDIDDFAVTATKLFLNVVVLTADSWTDNSPGAGSVAWNAHSIVYNGAEYPITAGNTSVAYIYWVVGDPTYSTSATHPALGNTKFMIAINTSGIHTLVWNSSANMVIGSAFIANAAIIEAKIGLLAVTDARIANATITSAKISDMSVAKLTAGTIQSKDILLAVAAGTGDVAIRAGKSDFTNTETGFILGMDDSDSDLPKFYIGNTTKYMNWTGAALTVAGLIQTAGGTGKRMVMDNSDNTLRFYDGSNNNLVTIDDDLPDFGNNPGLIVEHVDGYVAVFDDANRFASMTPGAMSVAQDTNLPCVYASRSGSTGLSLGVIAANIVSTATGLLFDGNANSSRVFSVNYTGLVNAVAGYADNGTLGVDGTFEDHNGNTITVSGGIITDLTT